jgi:hypothetical protein
MANLGLPTTPPPIDVSNATPTQTTATPAQTVSQSDVDFVMPFMDDFVSITSKSILDGFNPQTTRAF